MAQTYITTQVIRAFDCLQKVTALQLLHHPSLAAFLAFPPFPSNRRAWLMAHMPAAHSLVFNFRSDPNAAAFNRFGFYFFCSPIDSSIPFPNTPITSLLPKITTHSGIRLFHIPGNDSSRLANEGLHNINQQKFALAWLQYLVNTPDILKTLSSATTTKEFRPAILFTREVSKKAWEGEWREICRKNQCTPNNRAKLILSNPCCCLECRTTLPNHNSLASLQALLSRPSDDGLRAPMGRPARVVAGNLQQARIRAARAADPRSPRPPALTSPSDLSLFQTLLALMNGASLTVPSSIGSTWGPVLLAISNNITDPEATVVGATRARMGTSILANAWMAMGPYQTCFQWIWTLFKQARDIYDRAPLATRNPLSILANVAASLSSFLSLTPSSLTTPGVMAVYSGSSKETLTWLWAPRL